MFRRTVTAIMLTLVLTSILPLAFHIQPVETEFSPLIVPEESAAMQATINLASQEPPPTEWNKTYGGTNPDQAKNALVQTSDGGYALAGYTQLLPGNADFWLVKTARALAIAQPELFVNESWFYVDRRYNGPTIEEQLWKKVVADIEEWSGQSLYKITDEFLKNNRTVAMITTGRTKQWVDLRSSREYEDKTVELAYDPGYKNYEFPLYVGQEWENSANLSQTTTYRDGKVENISYLLQDHQTVISEETITVKAGNFTALKIKVDYGSGLEGYVDYIWFSSDVKNWVKWESYFNSTLVETAELQSLEIRSVPPKFRIGDRVQTTANLNVREEPGINYTIIDTVPEGASGQILGGPVDANGYVWWDADYDIGIRGWSAENWLDICVGQPPNCHISLQKDGAEIDQVDVSEFFDICVGGSTDDIGIKQVRFSNDDVRDGKPTGTWTEWYDWNVSSGDWNAATKIRGWAFYTPGHKEVWSEVIDGTGQTDLCSGVIFAPAPALPVLTSPLVITPAKEIYNVGDTLNAEFTIRNIGENPIILDVLTVGGRLNGMIPPEGAPDFTFQSITLHSDESHQYKGSLTLTQNGNYHFFIAYHVENPTVEEKRLLDENDWNTCIELGEGLTHTDRVRNIIAFEEGTVPEEINALREKIDRLKKLRPSYPPYLLEADSWNDAVSTLWADFTSFVTRTDLREKYDELYQTGFTYQSFRIRALIDAGNFLDRGDMANAKKYLQRSYTYDKLSWMSFTAAAEVFDGNIAAGQVLADGIRQGCEAAVRHGIAIICPAAAVWVDGVYMGFDFAFNAALEGWDQAAKDLLIDFAFTVIFKTVQFKDLEYNTLEDFVYRYSKDVPLNDFLDNRQFMGALGAELRKVVEDRIAEEVVPALVDIFMHYFESRRDYLQTNGNSPIELRVVDSEGRVSGLVNGRVKHEISMSLYYNKTVTILFPTDTYHIEVLGTDEGTYGLEITCFEDGNIASFAATGIPTSPSAIHNYAVDWDTLSQGAKSITVNVDSDGDGAFERTFFSDATLTGDEFTMALGGPVVESCNSTGTVKDSFDSSDSVYVKGEGYSPSATYDLYVVNATTWSDGKPIPQRIRGTATTITSDTSGNITVTPVWNAPITLGNYDIVVDVNRDGYYNSSIDALDQSNVQIKAGFHTIPEFSQTTILIALMVIIVSAIVIVRKKCCRDHYVQY